MKKINSILSGFLAVTFMMLFIPFFSACDGSEQYDKMVNSYDNLIKNYPDVFETSGEIRIKYTTKTSQVINSSDPNLKLRGFTRLTNDPTSDQGVYEPVLKASLLYVNRFIHDTDDIDISSGDAKKLNDKFIKFKNSVVSFKSQVGYLEEHNQNIGGSDMTSDNNLVLVVAKMYDLMIKANDFNCTFMEFYEKALSAKAEEGSTMRGTMERFYLRNLAHTCNAYVKVYLPLIYNSTPVKDGDNELYTGYNFSSFVNTMMVAYNNNKAKLQNFDKKTGELTGSDLDHYNYFLYITNYELLYQKSCRVMISMDKEWSEAMKEDIAARFDTTNTKAVSSTSTCTIGIVSDCHKDCLVMQDMLRQLVAAI